MLTPEQLEMAKELGRADILVLKNCSKWLSRSTSHQMLRINMNYLIDRFYDHGSKEVLKPFVKPVATPEA
jgi:hypothetical protein